MKIQAPSNERRTSQKSNCTAAVVHILMFWNFNEKIKESKLTGKYLCGRFIQGHSTSTLN